MGNSEPKNTKKLTVIITYTIAVVCLLLGLLLPFYYDKGVQGMLVMQLPNAIGIVFNKPITAGNTFVPSTLIYLFGTEKAAVDITAYAFVLYAVITFLALLAFIPMGITFKKGGKVTRILAYIIEIAAAIVLSIYVIIALEYAQESKLPDILNIWVAFGGTLLMLIIQCFVNKRGKSAGVKFILFLLSTVALCSLFSFYLITPKFNELWTVKLAEKLKCSPELYGVGSGMLHVNLVFADDFAGAVKALSTAADKTMIILGAIVSVFTLLNYFIDIIGLSTNAKRKGLIFNVIRYGIPFLAAICLFITVAVAKEMQGLALSLLFVIVAIELAINLGILLTAVVKEIKRAKKEKPVSAEQQLEYGVNDYANFERKPKPEPVKATEAKEPKRKEEPKPEPKPEPAPQPNPYANLYSQPFGSDQPSLLDPFGDAKFETKKTIIEQPIPAPQPEPEPEPEPEPPVQKQAPLYDPTVGYPAEYLKNEPQPEYKPPVQEYNPVQDYRNYQPVQDYQPAKQPVQEEPKAPAPAQEPDVHNVYSTYPPAPNQEQPAEQQRVYKVNTVYQGPTDEFLRKLTNDEKIEFAMIFIEKSKGEIGRVPEYAIGGDNKKFFSSVFIYLGRIRGIISDGLLNKMYKEINMFR